MRTIHIPLTLCFSILILMFAEFIDASAVPLHLLPNFVLFLLGVLFLSAFPLFYYTVMKKSSPILFPETAPFWRKQIMMLAFIVAITIFAWLILYGVHCIVTAILSAFYIDDHSGLHFFLTNMFGIQIILFAPVVILVTTLSYYCTEIRSTPNSWKFFTAWVGFVDAFFYFGNFYWDIPFLNEINAHDGIWSLGLTMILFRVIVEYCAIPEKEK